ncbi:hypothetical protein DFJ58DRAFT_847422 [Suillus subalutaceus]|uniref:uncharacterized protein n=1 Tax=Suillus subalutaceus TaxID=48586 RepID=UPI001B868E4B|nr:uncharacterized protein DFJ58DRAFT_847422 [Suillus subalutaceus]KAG1835371.1 hypothetical protein DFJ58DRAFT_847422 [Suillus subalutaceus]
MNFNLAPSSSNELQAEGSYVFPSTLPQRPYNLSAVGTPSTPSHHSSSPPSSPSLVSTMGSDSNMKITAADTTSDADDDMFPLTPNSKSSFSVANNPSNGAGPHNSCCSPESEHHDFVANSPSNGARLQTLSPPENGHGDPPHYNTTFFEDQNLFDQLSGRSVTFNDASEVISEKVNDVYAKILGELSTTSLQYVIQYMEAVRECHCMLYHAACWEVLEYARWEALARSMRENSKIDFLKAEQEVRFLLEIFGRCDLALSCHPVTSRNYPADARDRSKASICRTNAILDILNGAKEMRAVDDWCNLKGVQVLVSSKCHALSQNALDSRALGCSWERTMDNRGLSRHRASCHFFKKASSLASWKRQNRAKEAFMNSSKANTSQSAAVLSTLAGGWNVSHRTCNSSGQFLWLAVYAVRPVL